MARPCSAQANIRPYKQHEHTAETASEVCASPAAEGLNRSLQILSETYLLVKMLFFFFFLLFDVVVIVLVWRSYVLRVRLEMSGFSW